MTMLATTAGPRGAVIDRRVVRAPDEIRSLLTRLYEESGRQVPFAQARLLLREAASAIERLDAELARVAAELDGERAAAGHGPGLLRCG
jgi:acyl-CoA reductase-like NAD-dependent aldehyde dehydrogenase